MEWNITYHASVEAWLEGLDQQRLKAVAQELRLPHSRSLGQGLFELREKHYGLRLYYVFRKNKSVCLLHAGNKDSQIKDILKAKAKQVMLLGVRS